MVPVFYVRVLKDGKSSRIVRFGQESAIRRGLQQEGYLVVRINRCVWRLEKKASQRDTYLLLRLIGSMLKFEANVSKCLEQIAQEMDDSDKLKHVLFDVVHTVKSEGQVLSRAFTKHPKFFDPAVTNLLNAAEETQDYSDAFLKAADFMEETTKIKENFYKALIYPVVLLIVATGVIFITTQKTIPQILNSALMDSLPGAKTSTSIMMLQGLTTAIPYLISAFVALMLFSFLFFRFSQENAEKIYIQIPFIKEFIFFKGFAMAFFCASRLLEAVRMSTALEIIISTSQLHTIKYDFSMALEKLKRGENFVKGFTHLGKIETLLISKADPDNMSNFMHEIYLRFLVQYTEKMRALTPIVSGITIVVTGFVIFLIATGILIPYGQLATSILKAK